MKFLQLLAGKCYKCSSQKSVAQALESLAQKVQCGVVINFEKIGGADSLPPPSEGKVETLSQSKICFCELAHSFLWP